MADLTGHFAGRIGSFPCSQGKVAARIGGHATASHLIWIGLGSNSHGRQHRCRNRPGKSDVPQCAWAVTRDIYWKFRQIFSDPGELNFLAVPLDFASVHQVLDHADPPFELTDIYWAEADDAVGRVTAAYSDHHSASGDILHRRVPAGRDCRLANFGVRDTMPEL